MPVVNIFLKFYNPVYHVRSYADMIDRYWFYGTDIPSLLCSEGMV